jgi:hypothetical protein
MVIELSTWLCVESRMWDEVSILGLVGWVHTVKGEGKGLVLFSKESTGREW